MSQVITSGNRELTLDSHPSHLNSFVCALMAQRALALAASLDYNSSLYGIMCNKILAELERVGCYADKVPRIIEQPEVFRVLTRFLQKGIRIFHFDGVVRYYPYTFRRNEGTYDLFTSGQEYSSIVKVSPKNISSRHVV